MAKGGSQLAQLKSALSQAGVTRSQPSSKKRKRSGSVSQQSDKDKKTARLKEIQERLNPFDVQVTKLKHDVGGRKIKGVSGKPAQNKQAGIEQRKKTLLKEYKEKGHVGGVVDRRFGENDPTMSLEERMLERFTKEKQRSSRGGAVFNLEDEDELTHYGQSLSNMDDFDNSGLALSDEDEEAIGHIDARTVKHAHFGGFNDDDDDDAGSEPERKKSKAEVMAEVISKSKEHKALRQISKQQDEELRMELDDQLEDIRDLLFTADPSSLVPVEVQTLRDRGTLPQPSASLPSDTPDTPVASSSRATVQAKDLEFDQYVRELAFEKRAKPKNRTKTEEELALEEKERLEKQERRRRRRMNGEEDYDSEEESEKKRAARGGDDLDDDFYDNGPAHSGLGVGMGANEEELEVGSDDPEEEGGEDGKDDSGSDEEDEDEEGEAQGDESDDDSEGNESAGESGDHEDLVSSRKNKARAAPTRKELPYTFPCPTSHEEFLEIMEDVDDIDASTVVQRIRTLYHASLAEENKFKLQGLTIILIDHILHVSAPPMPRFRVVASLLPHLAALIRTYPIPAATHFMSKLSLMEKNLKRGLGQGALSPEARTFPGTSELALLRTVGVLWPTSDMHHAVVTPARVLMGAYLGLGRVRNLRDIASGLFLCTLWLKYEERAKRLVPEALNFVLNATLHLAPNSFKSAEEIPGVFPCPDFRAEHCRGLAFDSKKAAKSSESKFMKPDIVALLEENAVYGEDAKICLLSVAFEILSRFSEMYKGLDAFPELFQPALDILLGLREEKLPYSLQARLSSLRDALMRLLKFSIQSRRPLLLQAHKPIPIPTYVPKFESSGGSSSFIRNRDPDHERNEAAKLRRQYKQEKKGAMRELRKDARFLASVQQEEQREKDRGYNERMRKVFGSIEGERAEEKQFEREKSKIKKRAGKK